MNVSEAGRKRTADLVDDWAHDAKIVDKNHHVRGNALGKTGGQVAKEASGGALDVGETVAHDMAVQAGTMFMEHIGEYAAEGTSEVCSILAFQREALHQLSEAEEKGERIKGAFDNDAVNVAIAGNLAFDPAFAALEQAKRPGVIAGTTKLTLALQAPNDPIKPVLQARADEGYLAAERAVKATANIPAAQRAQALVQWFKDNGYSERLKTDIAFTKGVEYHAFVSASAAQHLYGIDAAKELAKVEVRVPVERPLMVRP